MGNVARIAVSLVLVVAGAKTGVHAQAENHWYNRFGDHSFLLGGAVIGGVSDLGSVFYNPGRLSLTDEVGSFVHARGFQQASVIVEDGRGPGDDLVVREFGGTPPFAAVAFTLPFWPSHTFAYSYLTRRSRQTELNLLASSQSDIIEPLPGTEAFAGSVDLDSEMKEDWFGFTWSTNLGDGLSLGASAFASHLSRDHAVVLDARASAGVTAAWQETRRYELSAWGLVVKAGAALIRGPLEIGLTVTAPQIQLTGSGKTRFDNLLVGVDTTSDGVPDDGFVVDRQEGLPATQKTPAAVGAGVAWRTGRAVVHLSAEWYSAVSGYAALESDSIRDNSGDLVGQYVIVSGLDPVLNVGGGFEWSLSDALSLYAGASMDQSSAPEGSLMPSANLVTSTDFLLADAIHFTGGISARTRWFALSTGISYSGSEGRLESPFPLSAAALSFSDDDGIVVRTRTWRFLIGLTLYIAGEELSPTG